MATEIENFIDDFARSIKCGKASFFIGSGISIGAGYADWNKTLKRAAEAIELDVKKEKDLITLAEYYVIQNSQRTLINETIKEFFSPLNGEPQNIHNIIASLPINEIWTTNYDSLIERSFSDRNISTSIITDDDSYINLDKNAKVTIYKLHGTYSSPNKCVITRSDYEHFEKNHDIVLAELKGSMCSNSFLFLGYSFSDIDIQHILHKIRLSYNKSHPKMHYYIMKGIKRDAYTSDEDYNYDLKKQNYRIKDMKSYGINIILIDDYSEIEKIIIKIRDKVYANNVLISGAYEYFNNENRDIDISEFTQELSKRLIKNNYKIYTGYGKNIGPDIVTGSYLGCTEKKKENEFSSNVFLFPFPYRKNMNEVSKKIYRKIRESMTSQTKIQIVICGEKKQKKKIVNSTGIYDEYKLSIEKDNLIIPIALTGGNALNIWNEMNLEDKYSNSVLFQNLNKVLSIDEMLENVMEIIKNGY